MEEKKQGGKRKGAGRKPVLHKKKQISLYVEGGKILKFGNVEKYKEFLYKKTDEYGNDNLNTEINYSPTSPSAYDGKKMDNITFDEPAMFQQPKINQYDAYHGEIVNARSVDEIMRIVRVIKDDNIPDWQKIKLEKMAIAKSKTFDF
jgi:hypothetical protein